MGVVRCSLRQKVVYLSKRQALHALRQIRITRLLSGTDVKKLESGVYQCPRCRRWHLTSQEQEVDAGIKV